ncbi:MAG: CHAT domain-containing protein [Candidatus Brocadiae bacterium]|nr:CHAT domain-containing protein [Candidatus Brocadiia bacterium]
MKKIVFFVLFFSILTFLYPQAEESLENYIKQGQERYVAKDFPKAIHFWEKGLQLAKERQDKAKALIFFKAIGDAYVNLFCKEKAIKSYEDALKITKEMKNRKNEALTLYYMGNAYKILKDRENEAFSYKLSMAIFEDIEVKDIVIIDLLVFFSKYFNNIEKQILYSEQFLNMLEKTRNEEAKAMCYHDLGITYDSLEKFDKAWEYFSRSLEIFQKNGNKKYQLKAFNGMGCISIAISDYPKALECFQKAITLSQELKDKEAEMWAFCNMGIVYLEQEKYSKALQYLLKAKEICEKDLHKFDSIFCCKLGLLYARIGNTSAAWTWTEKALSIAKEEGNKKDEALAQENFGVIYFLLGNYSKALVHYKEILRLSEEMQSECNKASSYYDMAVIYTQQGNYNKALEYAKICHSIFQKKNIKRMESHSTNLLGLIYAGMGDSHSALKYYHESWKQMKELGMDSFLPDSNIYKIHLENEDISKISEHQGMFKALGLQELLQKDYQKAKQKFSSLLSRIQKDRQFNFLFISYTGLGLACEGLEEYEEAAQNYSKACQILEKIRVQIPQAERIQFFNPKEFSLPRLEAYEGLARTSLSLPEGAKGSFYYTECTRARAFIEACSRRYGIQEMRISSDLAREELEIQEKTVSLYKRIENTILKEESRGLEELEEELRRVNCKEDMLIEKLRKEYPEYASIRYPQPMRWESIILKPDEVLIEYEVTKAYTIALVGKQGILKYHKIPINRKEIANLVKEYRKYLQSIQSSQELEIDTARIAKKLYDLLFLPLLEMKDGNGMPMISKDSRIIIMPDEILGILPFESLIAVLPEKLEIKQGLYSSIIAGIEYLGDQYDIAYYHSATALTLHRNFPKATKPSKKMLVLADPVFHAQDSRYTITQDEYTKLGTNLVIQYMGLGGLRKGVSKIKAEEKETPQDEEIFFQRLARTGDLANKLAEKVFPERSDILKGMEASEENLFQKSLNDYQYLVFATHGILDTAVPYIHEPALVLSQPGVKESQNGFLTLGKVMQLKLQADLVALTACQTGLGKYIDGEGVMGLGRAFQYAGARSVLVSLWSVDENSTTILVEKFFEYLKSGKSNRESIRLARNYIRSQGYEHPFFWTPFILIGE